MRTLIASLRKANGHPRSMPPELPGAVPYQTAMLDDAGMAASRALGWDPLHSRRTGGKLGVRQRPRIGKGGQSPFSLKRVRYSEIVCPPRSAPVPWFPQYVCTKRFHRRWRTPVNTAEVLSGPCSPGTAAPYGRRRVDSWAYN